MANAVQDRLIRIWASPQGAPKAAIAGTTETLWWGANPGTLLQDGPDKVGTTSVAWQAGKPVVTFQIPGVPGATAVATLDAKYMTEKVVVTQGSTTTEFTYSGYKDWNNPLNKIEVFYAGKMTEKKNGVVVRDLTTDVTETGNVFVIAPVPASVKKAITVTAQLPKGVYAKPNPPVTPAPTPRLGAHRGPERSLGAQRLDRQLHGGRRAPVRSDAGEGLQPEHQSDGRLRALLALTIRHAGLSAVQARALGQDPGARHVDEQVRPGDDLPAARRAAAGSAAPHLPVGERHHLSVFRR